MSQEKIAPTMHRFIEFRTIGRGAGCDLVVDRPRVADLHARAALRADGAVWLLARQGALAVNRGTGWLPAERFWLCAGDRVRLGDAELAPDDICRLFGVTAEAARRSPAESLVPGLAPPLPLALPAAAAGKARRNPDTGQLEYPFKESR